MRASVVRALVSLVVWGSKPIQSSARKTAPPETARAALVMTDQSAKKAPVRWDWLAAVSISTKSACMAEGSARSAPRAKPLRMQTAANHQMSPALRVAVTEKMIPA